jgi:hypothetical protein
MRTGPALDRRSNADDRIGSGSAGLVDCAVKGGVTRAIEDVAEFLDFAGARVFNEPSMPPPAPREPRKPIELTLLPTTSSPAEYCFRAKQ